MTQLHGRPRSDGGGGQKLILKAARHTPLTFRTTFFPAAPPAVLAAAEQRAFLVRHSSMNGMSGVVACIFALMACARGVCPPGSVLVVAIPPMYNDTYTQCALPCIGDRDCNATLATFCDIYGGEELGVCAQQCNDTTMCPRGEVCVARTFDRRRICMHRGGEANERAM